MRRVLADRGARGPGARRGWLGLGVAAVLALLPASAWAAQERPGGPAALLSAHAIRAKPAWRGHVLDRGDGLVYPRRVFVVGDRTAVEHRRGLEAPGGGVTTIHATAAGAPRLVLDLGVNTSGYVEVRLTRSDGSTVHLGYSESREFLSPDGDMPEGDPSLGMDDAPGSRDDDLSQVWPWRSPGIRGGVRWISLQLQGPGAVSIDYVRLREEHLHPSPADYAGHFLSSDSVLNRAWYASAYTFALNSVQDHRPGHRGGDSVVVDGAKRDRLVWLGDLAMENLVGAYSFSEARAIVRHSLALFSCQQRGDGQLQVASDIAVRCPRHPPPAGSPTPPGAEDTRPQIKARNLPEYTAWWIVGVHDYALYTGDLGFARRMLPVVRHGLAYFTAHLDSNGLFYTPADATNWHLDVGEGEDTHTNATLYRALRAAAALERRVGSKGLARRDAELAFGLRKAILAHLWDPTARAFMINSLDPANHTQDAQVEVVLDGIAKGRQARSALRFIDSHLRTKFGVMNGESATDPYMGYYISPYISGTEALARFESGDADGALGLIRREWGRMVGRDPGTVWGRMTRHGDLVPNPFPGHGGRSMAHGWSGGPVPALSGRVLGIRPKSFGWSRWIVDPKPGNLRWAQGQAPTPRGRIVSRWRHSGGTFVLTVRGPRDVPGTVVVPFLGAPRPHAIAMDGRVAWRRGRRVHGVRAQLRDDGVAFRVRGGHTFAWSAGG